MWHGFYDVEFRLDVTRTRVTEMNSFILLCRRFGWIYGVCVQGKPWISRLLWRISSWIALVAQPRGGAEPRSDWIDLIDWDKGWGCERHEDSVAKLRWSRDGGSALVRRLSE